MVTRAPPWDGSPTKVLSVPGSFAWTTTFRRFGGPGSLTVSWEPSSVWSPAQPVPASKAVATTVTEILASFPWYTCAGLPVRHEHSQCGVLDATPLRCHPSGVRGHASGHACAAIFSFSAASWMAEWRSKSWRCGGAVEHRPTHGGGHPLLPDYSPPGGASGPGVPARPTAPRS